MINFKLGIIASLSALILNFPVVLAVNFNININTERPSVEFSEGEKSCSKDDNFKIRRNFRPKSSTGKALMMYLKMSRMMKRFIKATSKKKSEKQ